MQLGFSAPQEVLDVISALGPTEDIRFSPDRCRFAVAAMVRQLIVVFDIEIRMTPTGKQIHLSAVVELSASQLKHPHGLDFIDNETLAVANRGGDLTLFRLPSRNGSTKGELILLQSIPSNDKGLLSPGSVTVSQIDQQHHEVLASRTFSHKVSRHVVATTTDYAVTEEQVLLEKWLDIPDGISIAPCRRWLAVCNHNTHGVLLYSNTPALHVDSEPAAVLRGCSYPHGLRFSDDGRYILVTDAGAPYVYVYFQHDSHWQGVYDPSLSLRVMDDPVFQSGNINPEEGGAKGLDIDCAAGVLVTTSPNQSLAFFDLNQILATVCRSGPLDVLDGSGSASENARDVRHELEKQQRHAQTVTNAILREAQATQAEHRAVQAEHRTVSKLNSVRSKLSIVRSKLNSVWSKLSIVRSKLNSGQPVRSPGCRPYSQATPGGLLRCYGGRLRRASGEAKPRVLKDLKPEFSLGGQSTSPVQNPGLLNKTGWEKLHHILRQDYNNYLLK